MCQIKKVLSIATFFLCYHENGDNMELKNGQDDFGTENTYKLYRTVYEIIHPAISKKNISDYKIIIDENLIPLRIFYPKKISKLTKAIIYVPGKTWIVNGVKNYTDVSTYLVKETDTIVIALDYSLIDKTSYNDNITKCLNTINYLIEGLNRVGIENESITVIGDSIGASILAGVASQKENKIPRLILLYPALNLLFEDIEKYPSIDQNNKLDLLTLSHLRILKDKYIEEKNYQSPLKIKNYETWPMTLIITGDLDPVRDEGIALGKILKEQNIKSKVVNLKFASHGFLNSKDEESIEECMKEIKKFAAKKER